MYAFLRRPSWMATHAGVVVIVALFCLAGFWQLNRLAERRALSDLASERLAAEPVSLEDALAGADDVEFRRVTARGTYAPDDEVLVRNRSHDGLAGGHVLTPLRLARGAVLVNRGWVPAELGDEPPIEGADAPDDVVEVQGYLRSSEPKRPFAPDDPATGRLTTISRIDVSRLAQQLDYAVYDVYLVRSDPDTSATDLPVPLDDPDLGRGPHLYYAIQWFLFAVIGVVGYPAYLRRQARRRAGSGAPHGAPSQHGSM